MSAGITHLAVVVPAHNEAATLAACLESLQIAAAHPALAQCEVNVMVVLDSCTDASREIAASAGVRGLDVQCRNVGRARDAGARAALALGAQWLCFTDADSRVAPDWLAATMRLIAAHACDAICGIVTVENWEDYALDVRAAYDVHYISQDGHRHIHGANLSVRASVYEETGGFLPLACHEDVTLVRRIEALGKRVEWSARPVVATSARRHARVTGGFCDFLKTVETQVMVQRTEAVAPVTALPRPAQDHFSPPPVTAGPAILNGAAPLAIAGV